jgi:hypothetical protein
VTSPLTQPVARTWCLRAGALALVVTAIGACGGTDRTSPGSESATGGGGPPDSSTASPGDSVAPGDSTVFIPGDSVPVLPDDSTQAPGDSIVPDSVVPIPPGIVFASFDLDNHLLGTPYNGSFRLPAPRNIVGLLNGARARGGRVMVKLSNYDSLTMNANHTFNLAKWKVEVARFKDIDFRPYLEDGTLIGHYLLDEPYDPSNWGGKTIPQAIVEEMAQYSKQFWPDMTTFVRAPPDYLAKGGSKYKYLDAGWAMYEYAGTRPDVEKWLKPQVAAAKKAGIGLVVGLNVLNGGTKASGIKGNHKRFTKWSMSATQLKAWGSVLMKEPYACAFFNWKYDPSYNARPDIQSAMAELLDQAKAHPETSCRR